MPTDANEQDILQIIDNAIQRREAGERLSDAEVIAAHPKLADRLQAKLKQLQIINQAQQLADDASIKETIDLRSANRNSVGALVFCSSCDSSWRISVGQTPGKVLCPTCGAELESNSMVVPHVGQQVRHYFLMEPIGSGGFGTVWRARDSKLECEVAIKIPRQERLSTDEIERFIREARFSAQLRKHPNIVSVHEADWDGEIAYIASDFIEGVSLGDQLGNGPIPFDEAVDLTMSICDALHHAHEAGIVHRDLKPDNILLDMNDVPHVTDFGLAKRESQAIVSEVGQIMGTAAYMSPEQAKGNSEQADRRSDVFSLGVILYEMLTGERPFRGSVSHTLRQIIDEDPLRLRAFSTKIPVDLETICLKCLEKDPGLRYQTMDELRSDLQRYQKHQPILARSISTTGILWRWCKRNPVIPWLSLALIFVTLGAMFTAGALLNRGVATLQEEVRTEIVGTLKSNAFHATHEFKQIIGERIEDVLEMSKNKGIYQALRRWNEANEVVRAVGIEQLKSESKRKSDNPKNIRFPPELQPVQDALHEFKQELSVRQAAIVEMTDPDNERLESTENDAKPYSWFINDVNGIQIARLEMKETLGTDFWYRSYFTGLAKDLDRKKDERCKPLENWETPRLSDIFVTETGDAYVIAISVPVGDGDGLIIGVVGIFVELGKLIELPIANKEKHIKMAIYDARPSCGQSDERALPIQHDMLHERLQILSHSENQKIPEADLSQVTLDKDSGFSLLGPSYKDPFDSNEEWLAVRNNSPIGEGLYVVMQMKESAIETPGQHLRTNLILLGLSVIGLSTAILIPMWIIILRRVVK